MTRAILAIAAAAAIAGALAWIRLGVHTRDLREPWAPFPEDEDGVQGPDPVTMRLGGVMRAAIPFMPRGCEYVLTDADRDWLATTIRTKPLGGM